MMSLLPNMKFKKSIINDILTIHNLFDLFKNLP